MRRRRWKGAFIAPVAALVLVVVACTDATAPVGSDGSGVQLSLVGPDGVSQAELDALAAAFERVDRYRVTVVDAPTLDAFVETTVDVAAGLDEHVLDVSLPDAAFGRPISVMVIASAAGVEMYRSTAETTLADGVGIVSLDLPIRYTGPGIRGRITDEQGAGVAGLSVNLNAGQSIVDAVATEEDGTYLFVDVPTGSYQVVPVQPDGVSYPCPDVRDVTIGSAQDAVVADFLLSGELCGTDVLVLSGGDVDDTPAIQRMLQNDPTLTVSTFFHVNELPGLDFLSRHDVVLLLMNGLFDESSSLGTQVADYVALGGNVVLASFYWQGRSDSDLGSTGWGTLETIDPFLSAGGATYQADTLGVVSAHPLTSGVSQLLSSSGYRGGAVQKAGTASTVVATWSDESPLVGYRVLGGGQRIVAVTLFPASGQTVSGDVQQLWENAVGWAGAAGGPAR